MAKQTNRNAGGAASKQSARKKSENKSVSEKIINEALEEIYASVAAEQKKTSVQKPVKQKKAAQPAQDALAEAVKPTPKKEPKQKEKSLAKEKSPAKTEKAAKKQPEQKTDPVPAPAENKVSERKTHVRTGKRKAETVARAATVTASKTSVTVAKNPDAKLRVIPLGGLLEVGKNMTLFECDGEILIVDCGIGFPDEDMPGIDLVIPDMTYLESNKEKIKGVVLTHGHEDHVGAVPYFLRNFNVPVYGTKLTLGILKNKLEEFKLPWKADLRCVQAGDTVGLGKSFSVEFIRVNHSIADACALAIRTPVGLVVHSGDFKLDLTPIEGEVMNLTRLGELGKEGVLLLLCESTNAERPGYTPSEKKVGESLEYIFSVNQNKRIVIATFSSNVHRVQQIIDTSVRHGRRVAITGRSMLNIVSAARELGYMSVPDGVIVDLADIKRYKPEELTLVTTGSQGEPMSALYRMAFGEHNQVTLGPQDLVVLSASAIPGNESLINRIVNEISKMGVKVLHDSVVEVHVSGHACQEEIKLMQALTKPTYYMPVHGEYKHLAANGELARSMGMPADHIFISDIGKVLELSANGAKFAETVPSGKVLVDGSGVGDVGNIVLRDQKHLSQDGLIVVVATVDRHSRYVLSGPDIVSRGFVYVRESEDLMEEMRMIAAEAMDKSLSGRDADFYTVKNRVKDDLGKFIFAKTKRRPMILPVIMHV
ncbi:MAG: RNase J family beta-CASP ribonuclease [Clostridia bacterium]|nr:RNase J family beta-CASP ribonuclease [Clostridia bacterium]